jgi:hypothetical protein
MLSRASVAPSVRSPPASRLRAWLGITVLASIIAYVTLVASFFPNPHGRLGHDYATFLPPLLADNYWIAENGLFALPYFSPAFCGGLPYLADPISIFYSVPQLLSFISNPVTSFFETTLIFAGLGGIGSYLLMRRRFGVSVPAATLSGLIFLFNGFLLYRMVVGHAPFCVVGLAPFLCHLLLTPIGPARLQRDYLASAAGPIAASAAIVAYFVYAGAPQLLMPLALTCMMVWVLHGLLRNPAPGFWVIGAGAAVLGAAGAAAKLVPAFVYVHYFLRPGDIMLIFPDAMHAVYNLFMGLFFPFLIQEHFFKHEYEYGLGIVPLVMIPLGISTALLRGALGDRSHWGARRIALLAGLALLAFVPLRLSYGPEFAAWLKSVPYIGEDSVVIRWYFTYLLPLTIATGVCLDFVFADARNRSKAALAGIVITVLPALLLNRAHYDNQPYDPVRIVTADLALRNHAQVPAITAIETPLDVNQRNDDLTSGISPYPCFAPVFGFHLDRFPKGLHTGPLFSSAPNGVHLRNPACYIYGKENGCTPEDLFTAAQRREEEAFAAYKSFDFVLPGWQQVANWVSALGAIIILVGLGLGTARLWYSRHPTGE